MKILVAIRKNDIATRFDLTMEVLIASFDNKNLVKPYRTVLLPRPSAEELCTFIIKENIEVVICGGIEEKHLKYLSWKKIEVINSVIGPYSEALDRIVEDRLMSGDVLPGAVKG